MQCHSKRHTPSLTQFCFVDSFSFYFLWRRRRLSCWCRPRELDLWDSFKEKDGRKKIIISFFFFLFWKNWIWRDWNLLNDKDKRIYAGVVIIIVRCCFWNFSFACVVVFLASWCVWRPCTADADASAAVSPFQI